LNTWKEVVVVMVVVVVIMVVLEVMEREEVYIVHNDLLMIPNPDM
jgi:hypothetical protein